ncbi:MAG: PAS domain S-box protein, partial [Desulfobulbaceae bacterium]|nr:PAS domain S-box protein [Desulfobulbaceae bacterium]
MLNDSDNAVFVHELTKEGVPGKFIEVNDVACQLLGYTRKELYTLTPLNIVPDERSHSASKAMEKLLTEREILFETWLVSKIGKKIPVVMNSQLLHLKGEMAVLSIARGMMESMETYERERGKLPEWEKEDLSLFYTAGHLFCSTFEQERVFQEVTRRCVDALHVDFCLLRLIEDGRLVLRNSFFRRLNEKEYVEKLLAENPIRVGEGIAGRVAQTGEPVTSDSLPVEELT